MVPRPRGPDGLLGPSRPHGPGLLGPGFPVAPVNPFTPLGPPSLGRRHFLGGPVDPGTYASSSSWWTSGWAWLALWTYCTNYALLALWTYWTRYALLDPVDLLYQVRLLALHVDLLDQVRLVGPVDLLVQHAQWGNDRVYPISIPPTET